MTISTTSSQAIFLGNGATSTFTFNFVCDSPSQFFASYTDLTGLTVELTPSQYTLFLNPIAAGSLHRVGGTITYPTSGPPITAGTSLTVRRSLPLAQLDSISNQGDFYPTVTELALDNIAMQVQQVSARTGQLVGVWQTATIYNFGDVVQDGANGTNTLNYYTCTTQNTSGVWATDLAAGYWALGIDTQLIASYATSAAADAAAAAAAAATASASAATAATSASNAATSASNAATSETNAANYAASYSATSATSVLIALGAQVFTTQASKLFVSGQVLMIASNASALNYMHGTVTSYAGTTLTMNITDIGGSGTYADWNISISGTQGTSGTPTTIEGGSP